MSTTETSPLLQPMQSNEMRSPNFLPHLPPSFDPQGLLEFQTKMFEMQRRITASSATASANSYIPNPPTNQEYLASLRFLVNTAGPYVVGTLDEKGFTVMHYVAGMIHDHGQVLELVEYVLKVWEIFHQGNTTEIENWSATSLIPHPLMEIEGKPVFEGSLFRDAAKSTAEEELYQKRLLSMKGYFPLAVATRAGNTKAIEIFINEMNASPFTSNQPKRLNTNEVYLSNSAALQVALDYGLASSVHTLLETALKKIRNQALDQTSMYAAATRILSPKMKTRKAWPDVLILKHEPKEKEKTASEEVWDIRDAYGVSPLHTVCGSKHPDELALNLIEILLHHKVSSVYTRDCSGRTILVTSVLLTRSPAFLHNLLNLPAFKSFVPPVLIKIMTQVSPTFPKNVTKIEARKYLMYVNDWEHGRTPLEWAEVLYGEDSSVARVLSAFM